jgi:hypothetical protein
MSKFKHKSTTFNFSAKEQGDITVTWRDAKRGATYRWDVTVTFANEVHTWNARQSPSRTAAINLIESTLNWIKDAH